MDIIQLKSHAVYIGPTTALNPVTNCQVMVLHVANGNRCFLCHFSIIVSEWSGAYWTVEDHEALVEMVMLHNGVAVKLGQRMVTPVHTMDC